MKVTKEIPLRAFFCNLSNDLGKPLYNINDLDYAISKGFKVFLDEEGEGVVASLFDDKEELMVVAEGKQMDEIKIKEVLKGDYSLQFQPESWMGCSPFEMGDILHDIFNTDKSPLEIANELIRNGDNTKSFCNYISCSVTGTEQYRRYRIYRSGNMLFDALCLFGAFEQMNELVVILFFVDEEWGKGMNVFDLEQDGYRVRCEEGIFFPQTSDGIIKKDLTKFKVIV